MQYWGTIYDPGYSVLAPYWQITGLLDVDG